MPRVKLTSRTQSTSEYIWTRAELATYLPGFHADEGDTIRWWMDEGSELHAEVITVETTGEPA